MDKRVSSSNENMTNLDSSIGKKLYYNKSFLGIVLFSRNSLTFDKVFLIWYLYGDDIHFEYDQPGLETRI